MTPAEVLAQIRRGIREPRPVNYADSDLESIIARGVIDLGLVIKEVAPAYFSKKAVLTSSTHVFAYPDDCLTVRNVWDTRTNAGAVEGATNASPISINITAHGFADDDVVLGYGVGGNTAANGTWKITYTDADNFTLDGSTGNAAWTSGGLFLKLARNMTRIERMNPAKADRGNKWCWYPQGRSIVVDYVNQSYDILIDYIYTPSLVADIPAEYHDGIVAYGVIHAIRMPDDPNDPKYADLNRSLSFYMDIYQRTQEMIRATMQQSGESVGFNELIDWEMMVEDWGDY